MYIQGMENLEQTDAGYSGNGNGMSTSSVGSTVSELSVESVLQGKPKRYNMQLFLHFQDI